MNQRIIESYENYGRAVVLDNGTLQATVTLDVGPRVISFGFIGGQNVFFNDIERRTNNKSAAMEDYYGKGNFWYLYGGHRLWMSPESLPHTYYPDNGRISCNIVGDTASFVQPEQKENGICVELRLQFGADNELKVLNIIKNVSDGEIKGGAWALSVMNKEGIAVVPSNKADTGLLPNRNYVMWPYADIRDERLLLCDDFIALRQQPGAKRTFKIGENNVYGKLFYFLNGELFTKSYDFDPNGEYPDYGCSVELFTCGDFLEAESLSPLRVLTPGAEIHHEEVWTLKKARKPEFTVEAISAALKDNT